MTDLDRAIGAAYKESYHLLTAGIEADPQMVLVAFSCGAVPHTEKGGPVARCGPPQPSAGPAAV